MSQRELDKAVAAVQQERPDEKVVHDAAGRVFKNLFNAAYLPDTVERIRGCADFQALIPGYLGGSLASARRLLLEDHLLKCVDCRGVLHEAKGEKPQVTTRPFAASVKPERRVPMMAWALAATLLVGIAAGLTGSHYGLLPGQKSLRATVAMVQGDLYRVSDFGSSLIKAGDVINGGDEIRSARGARALLHLAGGDNVEIGERSDVSLSRGWRGTTVSLNEGRLIMQSPGARGNGVYLAGGGMLVPVSNSVLSMDRGSKGVRVALARGSAEVQDGQRRVQLRAGQQVASSGLGDVPVASEFAWSMNADSYLPLLSEFSTLQKEFQNIPSPGLRFSSDLAKYAPADAVLYAAIPNLGGTITEAKQIFDDRLAQSEVLRNWWGQQSASHAADFDREITQIATISQYLGNEVLFTLSAASGANFEKPLILAEVRQPGLAEYLQQLPDSQGIQAFANINALPAAANGHLLVLINDNLLAASTEPQQLKRIAGTFTGTPFYARIAKSYAAGVEYLLAVDLEQIGKKFVSVSKQEVVAGMSNAQYMVFERRETGGSTDTRASVSFNGTRQGLASLIGAPGPVGSLEFVSPDASFAAASTIKSPRAFLEEVIGSGSHSELNEFEARAGVSVMDDIAAPLGEDVTFAVDGPMLPVPSWKLIMEVNDPVRLQHTIGTATDRFNQQTANADGKLQTGSEQVNSRTFYWVRSNKTAGMTIYYTFVDGYLLAGPGETNLTQAIQNRQSGNTLASSTNFTKQLPSDGYTGFSSVVYVNPGTSVAALAQSLNGAQGPQRAMLNLLTNNGPGLVCVYGEPDRMVAATRGFNFGMLGLIRK